MARNEKTSKQVASLAARVLNGSKKPSLKEIKKLAGAVLTQAPDKR